MGSVVLLDTIFHTLKREMISDTAPLGMEQLFELIFLGNVVTDLQVVPLPLLLLSSRRRRKA